MAPIEGSLAGRIVALDAGDIEDAVKLSAEAGWNQGAADWAMMLELGQGVGIKDEGRLVASGLALPHPPDFGWISMVLVTEMHRHRGLVLDEPQDHALPLCLQMGLPRRRLAGHPQHHHRALLARLARGLRAVPAPERGASRP